MVTVTIQQYQKLQVNDEWMDLKENEELDSVGCTQKTHRWREVEHDATLDSSYKTFKRCVLAPSKTGDGETGSPGLR
ncbi:unnamed protein product [Toxocara canis]|uniref:Intraflagellar transport protein 43 homolog n=1 Tax=Toxocara canis TaxID=6265 RepID=A0A183V4C5_TOXCA|nr:unnamed protein product [Toxocara canis]